MKRSTVRLITAGLLLIASPALHGAQECLGGTCFEKTRAVGSERLPLRGTALLEFMKVDMYTGALYAAESARSSEEVLGNIPKALVLHYHRAIKVSWMNRAAEKILKKNPDVNYADIKDRVESIGRAYQKVGRGDRYALVYIPKKGTTLYLNDEPVITVPGEDFQKAYFGIWLSQYPARASFRDALLETGETA